MQVFARWLGKLWARQGALPFPVAVWCRGATLLALHAERER